MRCSFDDIPFDILGGAIDDWTIQAVRSKEQVPYSNITIVEHIGHAPARVTWDLLFSRRDDWFAFVSRFGDPATGTLMLPTGLQSLKGDVVTRGNPAVWMDVLDAVAIDDIGKATLYRGGKVRASVTFERQINPITREAVS